MTEYDKLTADELRAGDVLLKNGEVTETVERVTKVVTTGEVIIVTVDADDKKDRFVADETDAMPGWVRGAQFSAALEDLQRAEQAAAEAEAAKAAEEAAAAEAKPEPAIAVE